MNTYFKIRLLLPLLGLAIRPSFGDALPLPDIRPTPAPTHMPLIPAPSSVAYATADAFPGLLFLNPTHATYPPGETNRLFVVEKKGLIQVIPDLASPAKQEFLDIQHLVDQTTQERGLLGMAFHPDYSHNGYFYLLYTGMTNTVGITKAHNMLVRFQVSSEDPNLADLSSMYPILAQNHDGFAHQASHLAFGPDGYLYFSSGDEGSVTHANNQRIDKDFFSGMFRIDVDSNPGNLTPNPHPSIVGSYRVPHDNPFVGVTNFNGIALNSTQVRTEFYAVGLRNPYRFGFDPFTGDLACGDVGQVTREELNLIVPGGNYGYAYKEGTIPGPQSNLAPPGFLSIPPAIEITRDHPDPRFRGNCIIYGFVYRGSRFPHLVGKHIFGDFGSNHMWSAKKNPNGTMEWEYLNTLGWFTSGLVEDPSNGDILRLSYSASAFPATIRRIVNAAPPDPTNQIPQVLSATGVFNDIENLEPIQGFVPYDVNTPLWSDHAVKHRWFYLPDTNAVITVNADGMFEFPDGAMWIKHFDLPLSDVDTNAFARIETRLLVKTSNSVYGVTYRYGTSTDDAHLVPASGLSENISVMRDGTLMTQRWDYPSRSDCLVCHNPAAGEVLGFQPEQLNKFVQTTSGGGTNQLQWLQMVGFVSNTTNLATSNIPLADILDESISTEYRARSYIHVNCGVCHRPGGGALGQWDGRISSPLDNSGIINGAIHGGSLGFGDVLVDPGVVSNSFLFARMANASIRMPPLGTQLIDTNATSLVARWIESLDGFQTYNEWAESVFGDDEHPMAGRDSNPELDQLVNYEEYLLGSSPLLVDTNVLLRVESQDDRLRIRWYRIANAKSRIFESRELGDGAEWLASDFFDNTGYPSAKPAEIILELSPEDEKKYFQIQTLPR